jgi:hypothetical protein
MILIDILFLFFRFPCDEHASDSSRPSRARRLRKRVGLRKSRIPVRTIISDENQFKQLLSNYFWSKSILDNYFWSKYNSGQKKIIFVKWISNGYSRANLASASTRQNGLFQKYARLARLADIPQAVLRGLARLADICQAMLHGLARLADIHQAVLHGLPRLAKGKFGECYVNLVNLASLANLANVG